jgi:hypothetical protein
MIARVVGIALILALLGIAALLVLSLTEPDPAHPEDEPSPYDVATAQAIGDPPPFQQPAAQACALTAPDDDGAFLAALEADLTRSRAVRRLTRRLETTR